MKGVILAGGTGSRLRPMTSVIGKQLLPVYDKPMIYYPLSTLILAGVREVLIIVNPNERSLFEAMLEDGARFGIHIQYLDQPTPAGLADGVRLAQEFVGKDKFIFILGDNLFFGPSFGSAIDSLFSKSGATILGYRVSNPKEYGVIEFDEHGNAINLVEKPIQPKSNWAIPGLYVFDSEVFEYIPEIVPSSRGELEIIDLLNAYLRDDRLSVVKCSRGNAWFDLGTPESLLSASLFIHNIQARQGLLVGSPEESGFAKNNLTNKEFELIIDAMPKCAYQDSLREIQVMFDEIEE